MEPEAEGVDVDVTGDRNCAPFHRQISCEIRKARE